MSINMKSKTLQLIERYQRLFEQDNQNPEAGMEQPQGGEQAPEMAPEEPAETIPLSSPAEIRYMEDVVLAALMEPPSGTDRIALENILDLLRRPDNIKKIQASGQTAKDLYQSKVLPIIRPAQQGQDIRDISDQMS
jgi:hypothetical protein